MPPDENHVCMIDVLDVADHDRWLILPPDIEFRLLPRFPIVLIQTDSRDGVTYCSALEFDISFDAIPIPAGQRLHVQQWTLTTMEKANDITLWLGDDPPLSNGDKLGTVFKRLTAEYEVTKVWAGPANWTAPKGTTIQLDRRGFQTIHLKLKHGSRRQAMDREARPEGER
jgi:hypothetical protein